MVNNALTASGNRDVRQADAEILALQVLAWLANDPDMLRNFCGATGVVLDELPSAAQDPMFLAGVLDFLCLDDAWIQAFAASAGVTAEAPLRARAALPGGESMNWT